MLWLKLSQLIFQGRMLEEEQEEEEEGEWRAGGEEEEEEEEDEEEEEEEEEDEEEGCQTAMTLHPLPNFLDPLSNLAQPGLNKSCFSKTLKKFKKVSCLRCHEANFDGLNTVALFSLGRMGRISS